MAESDLNVNINIKQNGGASLSNLAGGIANLGRVAATAAIGGLAIMGTAVAAVSAKLIAMGSDAQEMQGKFNVVMGEFAGPVTQQLATFASEVGRSRFELMGFSATIQDTLVPLGFARGAAADMSVEVVKLATDLASFNNLDTSQVIEDIQSALVGNTETLRKYGVVASQAAIEQYAMNNGLWDGKDAMDAQTKAAAIMGLIMDGTADAQGDAARTSESFANQMRALQASITDTATEIGLGLLPVVEPLLAMLSNLANNVLQWLMDKFNILEPVIAKIGAAFQQLADGNFDGFFEILGWAIEDLMEILGFSEEDIAAFGEYWQGLKDILFDDGKPWFDKIGEAIGFTLETIGVNEATLQEFYDIWDLLGGIVSGQVTSWQLIDGIFKAMFPPETVTKLWEIVDWANTLGGGEGGGEGGGALATLHGWLLKLNEWADLIMPDFAIPIQTGIQLVIDLVHDLTVESDGVLLSWNTLKAVAGTIWEAIKVAVSGPIGFIKAWISEVITLVDILLGKFGELSGYQNNPLPPGTYYDPGSGVVVPPAGGSQGHNTGPGGAFGGPSNNQGMMNNAPTYVMNVYGGDVGSMQSEFGAMASAAGAI